MLNISVIYFHCVTLLPAIYWVLSLYCFCTFSYCGSVV